MLMKCNKNTTIEDRNQSPQHMLKMKLLAFLWAYKYAVEVLIKVSNTGMDDSSGEYSSERQLKRCHCKHNNKDSKCYSSSSKSSGDR